MPHLLLYTAGKVVSWADRGFVLPNHSIAFASGNSTGGIVIAALDVSELLRPQIFLQGDQCTYEYLFLQALLSR